MEMDTWLTFAAASLLISISPGAGAINTISNGLQYGVKRTLPAIFGLQLGYATQIAFVGVGLGTLLASSTLAFEMIKWLGITYLVWLGYQKWREEPLSLSQLQTQQVCSNKQFWMATLVNMTNPKAIVFLLALFPQFIDPTNTDSIQYIEMGITLVVADIVVMLGYASLAAQLAPMMQSKKLQRAQNRFFGGMFVGAATLMAGYRNS